MTTNELIGCGVVLMMALALLMLPRARRVWWEWRNRDKWERF